LSADDQKHPEESENDSKDFLPFPKHSVPNVTEDELNLPPGVEPKYEDMIKAEKERVSKLNEMERSRRRKAGLPSLPEDKYEQPPPARTIEKELWADVMLKFQSKLGELKARIREQENLKFMGMGILRQHALRQQRLGHDEITSTCSTWEYNLNTNMAEVRSKMEAEEKTLKLMVEEIVKECNKEWEVVKKRAQDNLSALVHKMNSLMEHYKQEIDEHINRKTKILQEYQEKSGMQVDNDCKTFYDKNAAVLLAKMKANAAVIGELRNQLGKIKTSLTLVKEEIANNKETLRGAGWNYKVARGARIEHEANLIFDIEGDCLHVEDQKHWDDKVKNWTVKVNRRLQHKPITFETKIPSFNGAAVNAVTECMEFINPGYMCPALKGEPTRSDQESPLESERARSDWTSLRPRFEAEPSRPRTREQTPKFTMSSYAYSSSSEQGDDDQKSPYEQETETTSEMRNTPRSRQEGQIKTMVKNIQTLQKPNKVYAKKNCSSEDAGDFNCETEERGFFMKKAKKATIFQLDAEDCVRGINELRGLEFEIESNAYNKGKDTNPGVITVTVEAIRHDFNGKKFTETYEQVAEKEVTPHTQEGGDQHLGNENRHFQKVDCKIAFEKPCHERWLRVTLMLEKKGAVTFRKLKMVSAPCNSI